MVVNHFPTDGEQMLTNVVSGRRSGTINFITTQDKDTLVEGWTITIQLPRYWQNV